MKKIRKNIWRRNIASVINLEEKNGIYRSSRTILFNTTKSTQFKQSFTIGLKAMCNHLGRGGIGLFKMFWAKTNKFRLVPYPRITHYFVHETIIQTLQHHAESEKESIEEKKTFQKMKTSGKKK